MRAIAGILAGVVAAATLGIAAPASAQVPPIDVPTPPIDPPVELPTDLATVPGLTEIVACLTSGATPPDVAEPDPMAALAPLLCVLEHVVGMITSLAGGAAPEVPETPPGLVPPPGLPTP